MLPTFYLDLDRTTFRTEKAEELYDALAKLYPNNELIKCGYEQRGDYYVLSDDDDGDGNKLYCHDLVAQLRDSGIDSDEAFARLEEMLGDGRFEYPGVAALMQTLHERGSVKILTYGVESYQRFKARLCPSLRDCEIDVVMEPKSTYLNQHAGPHDWMIDDKALVGVVSGTHVVRVGHGDRAYEGTHSLEQVAMMIAHEVPVR